MQTWWVGRRGHLSSDHRHTKVTDVTLLMFPVKSSQIDVWSPVRLALAKKVELLIGEQSEVKESWAGTVEPATVL